MSTRFRFGLANRLRPKSVCVGAYLFSSVCNFVSCNCIKQNVTDMSSLSIKLFELGVLGVYFWANLGSILWPGVSIFGVFRTPSLSMFGVILGLLKA